MVAAAAAAALVAQALAACGPASQPQAGQAQAQPQQQGAPVTTMKVSRDSIGTLASYGGSILPRSQVAIVPRTAGRVTRLPVDVGQPVKAGDRIAELDHSTIDAQVAQAQANVASAQANLSAAQARLNTVLAGPKPEDVAVAQAQLDAAKIRLDQVVAGGRPEDVRSAEAAVTSAQARLDAAQTGGRVEDVLAAQAQLDSAKNRLAQVQAAGRPEDVRAAESSLASAKAKLQALTNPRQEEIAAAQASYDTAKTRMAQMMDAGAGSGVTARTRPEDMSTLELQVQRAQATLDKALGDQAKPPANTTTQQLQQAVVQAQIDLQIARNNLAKGQATGPTEWDVRLLQEAVDSAKASLDKLTNPSPADVAAAQASVDQAQSSLDKLKGVTPFDVEYAVQAVNQAQANLDKVRNPDPTTIATAQATLDAAVAALEKVKSPTQFEVDTAKTAVTQAEATLASRKNQYSQQDRQAAEAAVAQAQAAVDLQTAALQIQQANLNETFVTAPFDGVIADRAVAEGAVVTTNTTLMTLVSGDVEIVLNVEEQHIAKFQEQAPATFTVQAFPGEQFSGTVTSIFPTGDARSRTFTVKVRPDDQSGRLRPGMAAQITVQLERRDDVPVIPKDAVVVKNDKPYVFTVTDSTAALKPIEQGLADDRRVEIKSGLVGGEDVVISGQATLRDKDLVRILPAGGAQRPAGAQGTAGQQGQQAQQGAAGQQQRAGGQGAQGGNAGQQRPAGTPGAGAAAQQGGAPAQRAGG
jgi:RND family efflux transporter MFP subunit